MPSPFSSTPSNPPGERGHVIPQGSSRINISRPERLVSGLAGGVMAGFALDRSMKFAAPLAALGGYLLYRGASGHCPASEAMGVDTSEAGANDFAVSIEQSMTIQRSREEVYQMWHDLENLPRFMTHIETVTRTPDGQTRWRARVPGGLGHVEWLAEITTEEPGSEIAWRSMPEADVINAGRVRFLDAPEGRGTEVRLRIEYRPPLGGAGATVARWLNPVLERLVREDIRRFKQMAETGEVPTVEGQPAGR